jgi:CBS domain containing-hemolysin-like protein
MRGAVRARRTGNRVGFVIGGIVLTFLLAFFSLAQTVSVSATSYDLDRLSVERDRLQAEQRDAISNLNRLGREPAIRKLAVDAGLGPLPEPIVLSAR